MSMVNITNITRLQIDPDGTVYIFSDEKVFKCKCVPQDAIINSQQLIVDALGGGISIYDVDSRPILTLNLLIEDGAFSELDLLEDPKEDIKEVKTPNKKLRRLQI